MRNFVFALLGAGLVAVAAQPAKAADLSVRIEGLRNPEGLVRLAIFDKPGTFAESGEQLADVAVPAAELATGEPVSVFEGLAPGVYAVVAHHDENANLKFDTTFIGLPAEGYGFSNDAQATLSAPAFAEAAFVLGREGAEASFHIVYWSHTVAANSADPR
jgi:uncharacterized protein (DUF2141 family)